VKAAPPKKTLFVLPSGYGGQEHAEHESCLVSTLHEKIELPFAECREYCVPEMYVLYKYIL
jgi:hypothetical protein